MENYNFISHQYFPDFEEDKLLAKNDLETSRVRFMS